VAIGNIALDLFGQARTLLTYAGEVEGAGRDGRSQRFILPADGESVLDATLRVRPDAPYACKNAVCGTCRVIW